MRVIGTTHAFVSVRMDIFTSDTAILLFSSAGLLATAVSIVRDTKAQQQRVVVERSVEQIPVYAEHELAA